MVMFHISADDVAQAFTTVSIRLHAVGAADVLREYRATSVRPKNIELLRWIEMAAPMSDVLFARVVRAIAQSDAITPELRAFVEICAHYWYYALTGACRRQSYLLARLDARHVERSLQILRIPLRSRRITEVPDEWATGFTALVDRFGASSGVLRDWQREVVLYVLISATRLVAGLPMEFKELPLDFLAANGNGPLSLTETMLRETKS